MRTPRALAASAGVAAALTLALPATSLNSPAPPPPADTVVAVSGNAENGFEIEYADGSALFPPTDSEARAECSEYDTRIERVRCRTEVRVWYRELAVLQQALEHAHRTHPRLFSPRS